MLQYVRRVSALSACLLLAASCAPATPLPAAEDDKGKATDLKLDKETMVILDKDRNGMAAKTVLISTPTCMHYTLAPVVDGIKSRKELGWQEAAWASEEDEAPHGIEIQFAKPVRGGRFQVTWAYDINNEDGGRWWISRDYEIQTKEKLGAAWKTVVCVKGNQSAIGSYPMPDDPFSFLRIVQMPGGGHPKRPNLMWVGQVELTD